MDDDKSILDKFTDTVKSAANVVAEGAKAIAHPTAGTPFEMPLSETGYTLPHPADTPAPIAKRKRARKAPAKQSVKTTAKKSKKSAAKKNAKKASKKSAKKVADRKSAKKKSKKSRRLVAGSTLREAPKLSTLSERIKLDLRKRAEKKATLALLKTPRKLLPKRL